MPFCIYQPQTNLSLPQPTPSPSATTNPCSTSVSWFLFCRQVHFCHVLSSRYKGSPMVFVFVYLPSLSMGISGSNRLWQMPLFHSILCLIFHCVCVYLVMLGFRGSILGCRAPISPVLPPEAPGEGPSCLFQLLGAPGGPGLVAASLPCLPPSSRGFSVCLLLCLLGGHCPWMEGPPHPGGPPLRPFPSSHLQRPCFLIRSCP